MRALTADSFKDGASRILTMASYQITTARTAFTKAIADQSYACAGQCGRAIEKGAECFTKPFLRKGKVVGATRLHNLEGCWESYDDKATDSLATRRELRREGR